MTPPTSDPSVPKRRVDLRQPADLVATVFGVGLVPFIPGTAGSLVALPFAWWIADAGGAIALVVASVAAFAIGTWAAEAIERRTGEHDPGMVVIDEVVGQWLTLAAVPLEPLWFAAGFVLFRIFDIMKPWPVSWADRRVGGGFGAMLDDAIAGAFAVAVLLLARFLIGGHP